MSVAIGLYRGLTCIGLPAVELLLRKRAVNGREDPARLPERRGVASRARPEGELIWIHAASVGEANSCLRVIEMLLQNNADRSVLLTTGTVTSASMIETRLPARAIHQYYPVDRQTWVSRFLDHWKPDAAVWVESELWPNMIGEAARRNIPLALINARMSRQSERNWRFTGSAIRQLLSCFSVCLAQTPADALCFERLGARDAICVGNLKYSAAPPPADAKDCKALAEAIGNRPVWLAASTHPGDEKLVIEAHRQLAEKNPDLLTVIALRHPDRMDEVRRLIAENGLSFSSRSEDAVPGPEDSVFVVDTVGEMGLYYRYCPIVLVCGTFSDHGGHNPIEPAMLDCAILHGPDMSNFQTVAKDLQAVRGAFLVKDSSEVAQMVSTLLADPEQAQTTALAARNVAEENNGVIERVMERIDAMIAR